MVLLVELSSRNMLQQSRPDRSKEAGMNCNVIGITVVWSRMDQPQIVYD